MGELASATKDKDTELQQSCAFVSQQCQAGMVSVFSVLWHTSYLVAYNQLPHTLGNLGISLHR